MAKTSAVVRDEKRKKMIQKYAAKRAERGTGCAKWEKPGT